MKQIRATKNTPQGIAVVLMRFIGKDIFIKKKKGSPEAINLINQYRQKGIKVWESREWIRIDLLGDETLIKLGQNEIDFKDMTEEEKEKTLADFYIDIYKKGGFIVETQDELTT